MFEWGIAEPDARLKPKCPVFYVSPTQINFALPARSLPLYDYPAISIEHVGQPFATEALAIPTTRVAPALFRAGSSYVGVGSATRILPNGDRQDVAILDCGNGDCRPVPIDMTQGPIYLTLYGTGWANFSPIFNHPGDSDTVHCGNFPVTYAGPQGHFPGLDQVNLYLDPPGFAAGQTRWIALSPTSTMVPGRLSRTRFCS